MHRFFVAEPPAERAFLGGEQARQIATVLRLAPGERIVLLAGGVEHEVELQAVAPALVSGRVVARRPVATELPFVLDLALPLLKGDRSEEIVEAASQLGVRRFIPFAAARSVVHELSAAKQERWRRIAREAAETAHRGVVPEIAALHTWEALVATLDTQAVVCWEEARGPRLATLTPRGACTLVVGPEGGLAGEEVALARARGARVVSLGPRILRAETAAISAVALVAALAESGVAP